MKQRLSLTISCASLLALCAFLLLGLENERETGDQSAEGLRIPSSSVKAIGSEPLLIVSISPESRVKAGAGTAKPILEKGAWTDFAIEIENAARITSPLFIESAQAMQGDDDRARDRWLKIELRPPGPLNGALHERRTVRLWSRDSGKRAAVFNVNAGQGTQDLGFRSDVLITFDVAPPAEDAPE